MKNRIDKKTIVVVGLGKIGSMLFGVLNEAGHEVWGIDLNSEVIKILQSKGQFFVEPKLSELLSKCDMSRTKANYVNLPKNIDYFYIIVPTPSLDSGDFDLQYLELSLKSISRYILNSDSCISPTVVINSTVTPGSCEELMSQNSIPPMNLIYSPMFIALGDVYTGITKPDLVLIGSESDIIGKKYMELVTTYVTNSPAYKIMSTKSAELTKIALNSFITLKISFANYIAEIAHRLSSANVNDILDAIGSDSRVGKKYLAAGPSFGGPCFPRDNRAMSFLSNKIGLESEIPEAIISVNKSRSSNLINRITQEINATFGKVLILGVSYKYGTDSVEESFGMSLITFLESINIENEIYVSDPLVDIKRVSKKIVSRRFDELDLSEYSLIILCLNFPNLNAKLENYGGKVVKVWGI
jgi:UDPglucose 6-dehydrogenase